MADCNLKVECPDYGKDCGLANCPRFLAETTVDLDDNGEKIASGFCHVGRLRYFSKVSAEHVFLDETPEEFAAQTPTCEVRIGKAFPFIVSCIESEHKLKMNVFDKNNTLQTIEFTFIDAPLAWNIVKQFVQSDSPVLALRNPRPAKNGKKPKLNLSAIFRHVKIEGDNRELFFKFVKPVSFGVHATYTLVQQMKRK